MCVDLFLHTFLNNHFSPLGFQYIRYFIRGRPDLVPSMMYGIDAGEMEPTELPKDEPRGPMTEGEASIEENKKHKDELKKNGGPKGGGVNKNKQKKEKTKEELHDDAVVAAAMEVHRRQQREMRERRVLEQQEEMDRKVSEAMKEAHQREPHSSVQSNEMMNSKVDQGQNLPTPYNPTDYDIAASDAMSRSPKASKRQFDEQIRDRIQANLRQQHMMHNKAMELQQQQEQQHSSSPKRQKQYQKPPNGMLHTSKPGYKQPSRRKADVLKRKHQQEELQQLQARQQQIQQEEMQLQARQQQLQQGPRLLSHGSSQGSSTGQQDRHGFYQQQGHDMLQPGMYNQRDFLYKTQVRRNLADMQTGEMPSMEMLQNSRRNNSIPMGPSSTRSSTMEMLRRQHLNIISPPENSEQQQCLNDIERQILSEMSYPMLPTANPNSSLYTGRNNMRERMERMMMGRGGPNSMMSSSDDNNMDDLQRNNSCLVANQEMVNKILASSKTHEEIMMMAARDLQSRGIGGGSRDQMKQQQSQQRNFQHSQFDDSPHQQRQSMQQQFSEQQLQQRNRSLSNDEMMMMAAQREQQRRRCLSHDEMMMMATQRGQQQQHQNQHHQYEPPSPRSMRMQQVRASSGTSSHPPSRATRLHEMMLRELEDKVERETILAEAAAVQAAGLRENLAQDVDYVDDGYARRGLKRRNSRPAAA